MTFESAGRRRTRADRQGRDRRLTLPILFLDIDGVLNPYGSVEYPDGFVRHDLFPDDEPVHIHPAHGPLIRELGLAFEVVWASSWNDDANRLLAPLLGIAPLNLVQMPVAPFDPAAKVPLVGSYAANRPAAWIDDLHTAEGHAWAAARATPTLLITADPSIGLTRAIVDEAIRWDSELGFKTGSAR